MASVRIVKIEVGVDQFGEGQIEGAARTEGAKRPRIEGAARTEGAKRPRIESVARTEGAARDRSGEGSGEGARWAPPQNIFENFNLKQCNLEYVWNKNLYILFLNVWSVPVKVLYHHCQRRLLELLGLVVRRPFHMDSLQLLRWVSLDKPIIRMRLNGSNLSFLRALHDGSSL